MDERHGETEEGRRMRGMERQRKEEGSENEQEEN